MSSNSQSESNLPKALAADLKKFDKAELQKTKTEEKVLTPSLAAAGKPIKYERSQVENFDQYPDRSDQ